MPDAAWPCAGSVYVVRALPDTLPKAPAALLKTEVVAEQAPDVVQPGLVSSLLEREEASAPPPAAAAPRTRKKPLVDYASIYKFLGTLPPPRRGSAGYCLYAATVAHNVGAFSC